MDVSTAILSGLALHYVLGAAVMAWLDAPARYDGRLIAWVQSAPMFVKLMWVPVFLVAWPILAKMAYRDMRR